jgi:alpha/beta superfamily hydrolase
MASRATLVISLVLLVAMARASVPLTSAFSVERLPNGNTLIADGGDLGPPSGRVVEVDSIGRLVWAYVKGDVPWVHTARRLGNGNTLLAASLGPRVVEVDSRGEPVWEFTRGIVYPNEAYRLANGNTLITDRDNGRIVEVTPGGAVAWEHDSLYGPHNGSRLDNGNTLVCDSDSDRVLEVTPAGAVVWQYAGGLDWPRSSQRLPNGHTLIGDTERDRVIEVDAAGDSVWACPGATPYEALRLENGHTLISCPNRVIEVDSSRMVTWTYPRPGSAVTEVLQVVNPASGCSLYVHIHRPTWAGPQRRVPAVILVPDQAMPGTTFDSFPCAAYAHNVAADGFAVLHFDADGRGQSQGQEDYDGAVHQDGLAACAAVLASRAYVDTTRIGIYSQGYGIAMAAGMLARHSEPRIKFLMDFEGPSDRYQVCRDSGGFVPVSPDSESFWPQREAANTIRSIGCAYLRIQSETDHTGRIPDNHHCVALIDSATSIGHGGAGRATWTRANDSTMNPENQTYVVTQPPNLIPDLEEVHLMCRELLCLRELADRDFPPGTTEDGYRVRQPEPVSLTVSPNPCRGRVTVRGSSIASVALYDPAGRRVRAWRPFPRNGAADLDVRRLAPGVYILRAEADGCNATRGLVVQH